MKITKLGMMFAVQDLMNSRALRSHPVYHMLCERIDAYMSEDDSSVLDDISLVCEDGEITLACHDAKNPRISMSYKWVFVDARGFSNSLNVAEHLIIRDESSEQCLKICTEEELV